MGSVPPTNSNVEGEFMSIEEIKFYISYIRKNNLLQVFHEWCRQFNNVSDEDTNNLLKLFYEEREMNHV